MSSADEQIQGFGGLHVVAFESRHTEAMRSLITTYGGVPLVAPALREVPLEENQAAFEFGRDLVAGQFDMVIFLTGVGTRFLSRVLDLKYPREQWVTALSRTAVIARGPKPVAALKELNVPIRLTVPEPNTWRELLAALDEARSTLPLAGCRIAVQEYGVPNDELLKGLQARGASVRRVPVYQWALPFDTTLLCQAIEAIVQERADVVLFTTSAQVVHLMQVAAEMGLDDTLRQVLTRMVIASIGPTTSERLNEYGLKSDLEPSHPKMGLLVKETAEWSQVLVRKKKSSG